MLNARGLAWMLLAVASVLGCDEEKPEPSDPLAGISMPGDKQKILDTINPAKEKPYQGPTGAVAGRVTIKGDTAPPPREPSGLVDPQCRAGVEFYQSAFRTGPGRTAADVLVAVTGYSGFLPAREASVLVTIDGKCRYDRRTVVATYGQTIQVRNEGPRPFNPQLRGSRASALLVIPPQGEPVSLYPEAPGRFLLQDAAFDYMAAQVYILKYSTFDVTGLDGEFSIGRIPPGEVLVSAFLPSIGVTVEKRVTIEPGKTKKQDFELQFDAEEYAERLRQSEKEFKERLERRSATAVREEGLEFSPPAASALKQEEEAVPSAPPSSSTRVGGGEPPRN